MSSIPIRPRRSALYMPASNARAMKKAASLDADILIFDLEDSVTPDAKPIARAQAEAALATGLYAGREVLIRVNAGGTPWHDEDVGMAVRAGAQGIVLPKVNAAQDIAVVAAASKAPPAGFGLWAMIESPRGVLNAAAIADAHPSMAGLIAGTNDLAKELGATPGPQRTEIKTALSLILLAARAAGLAALDGVHNDIQDLEGFVAACRQARAMGFDGKTLIHPGQIEPCQLIFSPDPKAVENARALITAFESARAEGKGVALHRGRMIEALHVEEALRLVALAEILAQPRTVG